MFSNYNGDRGRPRFGDDLLTEYNGKTESNYCSHPECRKSNKRLDQAEKALNYNHNFEDEHRLCRNCAYRMAKKYWELMNASPLLREKGWENEHKIKNNGENSLP